MKLPKMQVSWRNSIPAKPARQRAVNNCHWIAHGAGVVAGSDFAKTANAKASAYKIERSAYLDRSTLMPEEPFFRLLPRGYRLRCALVSDKYPRILLHMQQKCDELLENREKVVHKIEQPTIAVKSVVDFAAFLGRRVNGAQERPLGRDRKKEKVL